MNCVWCGSSDGDVEHARCEVKGALGIDRRQVEMPVHPRHREEVEAYLRHYNRYAPVFVGLIAALTLAMIGLPIYESVTGTSTDVAGGVVVTAMGLVITVFPFATPTTTGSLGIRTSRRIVRALAVLVTAGAFTTLVL
jgi:hypothetical protein